MFQIRDAKCIKITDFEILKNAFQLLMRNFIHIILLPKRNLLFTICPEIYLFASTIDLLSIYPNTIKMYQLTSVIQCLLFIEQLIDFYEFSGIIKISIRTINDQQKYLFYYELRYAILCAFDNVYCFFNCIKGFSKFFYMANKIINFTLAYYKKYLKFQIENKNRNKKEYSSFGYCYYYCRSRLLKYNKRICEQVLHKNNFDTFIIKFLYLNAQKDIDYLNLLQYASMHKFFMEKLNYNYKR